MSLPVRKGYSVNHKDYSRIESMQKLEEENFIITRTRIVVTCKKCRKINPVPKENIEKFVTCFNCRKRIGIHKTFEQKQIQKINYDTILNKISQLFTKIGYEYSYDKLRRCWLINFQNKIVPILIPEISNSHFLVANSEKEGTLFITLDKDHCKPIINSLNSAQFVEFSHIYNNPDSVKEVIKKIVEIFDQNISLELEEKFSKFISNISPSQFEKFCEKLLKEVKNKSEKLSSFYNYLNRKENTLVNSKIIMLGGPSNPDFYIMNLNKYLQSGLKPELFGEVKRYNKSTFTFEDFSKAIVHADNKPNLFIVSTNNIQIEVWKKIIEYEKDGKYLQILLDKDLILLLIKCLELDFLLKTDS